MKDFKYCGTIDEAKKSDFTSRLLLDGSYWFGSKEKTKEMENLYGKEFLDKLNQGTPIVNSNLLKKPKLRL